MAVSVGVNRSFSGPLGDPRTYPDLRTRAPLRGLEERALHALSGEAADVSNRADFGSCFKDLRPVISFVRRPVPSGGGYLVAGLRAVNRPFLVFRRSPEFPDLLAKARLREHGEP